MNSISTLHPCETVVLATFAVFKPGTVRFPGFALPKYFLILPEKFLICFLDTTYYKIDCHV